MLCFSKSSPLSTQVFPEVVNVGSKPRNTKTESSVPAVRHRHATATNPKLELKVMVAVRCGYRSILERTHKSLSTFHFNFLHKSQVKSTVYRRIKAV